MFKMIKNIFMIFYMWVKSCILLNILLSDLKFEYHNVLNIRTHKIVIFHFGENGK